MKQILVRMLLFTLMDLICSICLSQVLIKGNYKIKQYVSYQQKQQADYRGTGSWEKFPCSGCVIFIFKIDNNTDQNIKKVLNSNFNRKEPNGHLATFNAYWVYTDNNGDFSCPVNLNNTDAVYIIYNKDALQKRKISLNRGITNSGIYVQSIRR